MTQRFSSMIFVILSWLLHMINIMEIKFDIGRA